MDHIQAQRVRCRRAHLLCASSCTPCGRITRRDPNPPPSSRRRRGAGGPLGNCHLRRFSESPAWRLSSARRSPRAEAISRSAVRRLTPRISRRRFPTDLRKLFSGTNGRLVSSTIRPFSATISCLRVVATTLTAASTSTTSASLSTSLTVLAVVQGASASTRVAVYAPSTPSRSARPASGCPRAQSASARSTSSIRSCASGTRAPRQATWRTRRATTSASPRKL